MRNNLCIAGKRMGFTLVELLIAVVASIVVAFIGLVLIDASRPRCGGRQIKDSTQVRGIHQGLVMWAQNSKDQYPVPSDYDKMNTTLQVPAAEKDTTSNIISILIYNGFFGPELCVSPAESNPAIKQMANYQYSNPTSAASPGTALWDPAFNADFTAATGGHFSYAHLMPAGERRADWSNTFSATTAVVSNRGPQVQSVTYSAAHVPMPTFRANSNTLAIHGGRTTWEGNVVYNDNHVNFETRMAPDTLTFKDSANADWGDCLFFDEPEDVSQRNALLSIWTRSGATPAEYKAIWD
ncbi:MAG TPA: prepilin-type N-terminal cleavage/methylation domain-containing protein [Phycisphaerales bacterium]|nr:prepilin-type N-terminal cleavage/methylation domain-containing protein [Phycisphaerales bacterium]